MAVQKKDDDVVKAINLIKERFGTKKCDLCEGFGTWFGTSEYHTCKRCGMKIRKW